MKKTLKILIKIVVIIVLILVGFSTFILVSCDWSLPKVTKLPTITLTLNKYTFLCGNECYYVAECDPYYDLCTRQNSSVLLKNVKKINDVYQQNKDTIVIVVPKGTNLSKKWNYKELRDMVPERKETNDMVRDEYGYFKPYKINVIVEYK